MPRNGCQGCFRHGNLNASGMAIWMRHNNGRIRGGVHLSLAIILTIWLAPRATPNDPVSKVTPKQPPKVCFQVVFELKLVYSRSFPLYASSFSHFLSLKRLILTTRESHDWERRGSGLRNYQEQTLPESRSQQQAENLVNAVIAIFERFSHG